MDMKLNMIFSILSGILIWAVIIWVIVTIKKNQRWKESHPSNDTEKAFVADVIAAIRREAPDFDGARVTFVNYHGRYLPPDADKKGISFSSLSGRKFGYRYASHGYIVTQRMAFVVASEIARQFGGEVRRARNAYDGGDIDAYDVISPRQLAEEEKKKHRFDHLTRI